jgi:hypothetical protein
MNMDWTLYVFITFSLLAAVVIFVVGFALGREKERVDRARDGYNVTKAQSE